MSVRAERPLNEYLRGIAHNFALDFRFVNDLETQEPLPLSESLASPEPPPLSESLASPEPPILSESLASPEPPILSESLASPEPPARSIFVPTTPSHRALIGRSQSLTPQSLRSFVPSTASFVTLQVASNDAHIIAPPPQFSDALFSQMFSDNY